MKKIKHPFTPIINNDSKILILGSFPSVQSRKQQFYYMHPQNRFYKVLSKIYNEDFVNVDINTKINLLNKYNIALYDIVDSCTIHNSDDSTIQKVIVSDLYVLLKKSNIKKIYLNGKKAYEIFSKNYPELINISLQLPSTSSANALYSLEKLYTYWKVIKQ